MKWFVVLGIWTILAVFVETILLENFSIQSLGEIGHAVICIGIPASIICIGSFSSLYVLDKNGRLE